MFYFTYFLVCLHQIAALSVNVAYARIIFIFYIQINK